MTCWAFGMIGASKALNNSRELREIESRRYPICQHITRLKQRKVHPYVF